MTEADIPGRELKAGISIDQQSDEYFLAHSAQTGRMISAAAYFDDSLTLFLSGYLGLSELQEDALLRPMSTRAKVDLVGRLAKRFIESKVEKELRAILNEALACLDERNALVHGVPGQVDGRYAIISWSGKKRLDPQPEAWPVERVCQLASRFMSLHDFFDGLEKELAAVMEGVEG